MRAVEADMFHQKFMDADKWSGTVEENRAADKKIAAAVRSSLMSYEKNTKAPLFKGSVFKFR